jgi:hypothetical protein
MIACTFGRRKPFEREDQFMLQEALKVVEAARSLGLSEKNGKTYSPLNHVELTRSLENLRLTIEAFDKFTELGQEGLGDSHKPGFSTPPQLDDEGMAAPSMGLTPKFFPGEFDDMENRFKDKDLEAETELKKKQAELKGLEERIFKSILIPASRRDAKFGQVADYSDLSDNLLFDNDESVGDFLLAIDRIDDKLGLYASKHGWSPRLRALAQAGLEMRKRLILEIREGGVYLTIPAHIFSGLTATIADAVADRDMRMLVPELRAKASLKKDLDEEYRVDHLPKPKMIL